MVDLETWEIKVAKRSSLVVRLPREALMGLGDTRLREQGEPKPSRP
jgi:hypothetical protein